MRTTIRMKPELARRAKQYAARHNRTFTQVVEEAVMELLRRPPTQKPPKPIVLPTSNTRNSKPVTEKMYREMVEQMLDEDAERILRPPTRTRPARKS